MTITADNLSCAYDERAYLTQLSFHVTSHLSILGANGAGKSMLARTLCGLLPYQGSLKLHHSELQTLSSGAIAKTLSYIPAKLELFDRYTTVEEFALLGRYPYKDPYRTYTQGDREDVNSVLMRLKLDTLKQHPVTQLSSGQQQLLLIAQALIQNTTIMIFDEPTANLAPHNTLKFARLFRHLQTRHTTILITHDLALAAYVKGSALFLHDHTASFYEDVNTFLDTDTLARCYRATFHPQTKALLYE